MYDKETVAHLKKTCISVKYNVKVAMLLKQINR